MTSRDFCFWLHGFFELKESEEPISDRQVNLIKAHLNLVFKHEIDPAMGDANHQAVLNAVHNSGKPSKPVEATPYVPHDPFGPPKPFNPPKGPNGENMRC